MIDLFRFVSLRPPQTINSSKIVRLNPSDWLEKAISTKSTTASSVSAIARGLLAAGDHLAPSTASLFYGAQYPVFLAALANLPQPPALDAASGTSAARINISVKPTVGITST